MNTKPTPEEVGKMCVDYIERNGYEKFSKEFCPIVYRKDYILVVNCPHLGTIPSPYDEEIAQHQERIDEANALCKFNTAIAKLNLT